MDRQWDKRPKPLAPPRLAREHASFSAALLDAIYRSIDTSPGKQPESSKNSASSPDISSRVPPAEFWREPRAASIDNKSQTGSQKYPSTPRYAASSTSSTSTPRRRPPRPNRVRPDPSPAPASNVPPNDHKADQIEFHPKNDKKRAKKKRSIVRLLKSLLCLKRDDVKAKPRLMPPPHAMPVAAAAGPSTETVEPIGSSARSCMSSRKKPEGPKRSVRFAPVSTTVNDEECKPCSTHRRAHVHVHDGAVERRVEELIKVFKVEERGKRKGSGGGSAGSDDISELDSLVAAACEELHN